MMKKILLRPVAYLADNLCAHYHHIFCERRFEHWDDWNKCMECWEPYAPKDYVPAEGEIFMPRHAGGEHDFTPEQEPLGFPFPQISAVIRWAICLY